MALNKTYFILALPVIFIFSNSRADIFNKHIVFVKPSIDQFCGKYTFTDIITQSTSSVETDDISVNSAGSASLGLSVVYQKMKQLARGAYPLYTGVLLSIRYHDEQIKNNGSSSIYDTSVSRTLQSQEIYTATLRNHLESSFSFIVAKGVSDAYIIYGSLGASYKNYTLTTSATGSVRQPDATYSNTIPYSNRFINRRIGMKAGIGFELKLSNRVVLISSIGVVYFGDIHDVDAVSVSLPGELNTLNLDHNYKFSSSLNYTAGIGIGITI